MEIKTKLTLAFFVIIFITSCAGRNFVRPESESLVLSKTTYQEIINRFGSPYQEGTVLKNEKTVKTISYAYATTVGSPLFDGVTATRAMGYYFSDNILVDYEFISSFKEDNSYFNENKINQIKKGESTRNSVIELIGKPSGMYIFPLIKNNEDNALVYLYLHVKGFKSYRQLLVVSFDNNGLVSDINFTSSGQK